MGPLDGIKVIEFSALGPGPFCGMILADLGAEVIVIDRIETAGQKSKTDIASRGKKSIAIDLKKKESINLIKDIVKEADVVIEDVFAAQPWELLSQDLNAFKLRLNFFLSWIDSSVCLLLTA